MIGFVLAVIIGIVTIALVSYKKQPKLTDGEKQELDNTDLLKRQTSPERAKNSVMDPQTSNYGRTAYEEQGITGATGFDAKQ